MKKISLLAAALLAACLVFSQSSDYRVVFDMTSKDSVNQQAVIREIGLIKGANPDAKLEVVIYGQGLSFVLKDKSAFTNEIAKMLSQKDVAVKVCAMTMKRNNVDESQLVPGVQVVPDGIYEIISRQRDGWGYIKVAH